MVRSVLVAAAAAAALAPVGGAPAVAQGATTASEPATPTEPLIRIRLAPELGAMTPAIRQAVEQAGGVVSEEGQFEIVNDILVEGAIQLRTAGIAAHYGSAIPEAVGNGREVTDRVGVVVIGKMTDGSAIPRLKSIIQALQWRARMIERSDPATFPKGVEFCSAPPDNPKGCVKDDTGGSIGHYFGTKLRNRSPRSVNVAMLQAYGDLTVKPEDLGDGRTSVILRPGETLTLPVGETRGYGLHRTFLIVSEDPIDVAAITDINRNAPVPADVRVAQFALNDYRIDEEPQPAMGGGYTAGGGGEVDWIVEMYDPKPYTQVDLDKDKAKGGRAGELTDEERAHTCGGTMIGPNLVLTAAHCVATGRFQKPRTADVMSARRIRGGSLLLGKGGATMAIVGVAVHAGYTGAGAGLPNDIALLKVAPEGGFRMKALTTATAPAAKGTTVTGLGWGFTKPVAPGANPAAAIGGATQRNPGILQAADMEVLDFAACQQRMGPQVTPGMICLVTPKSVLARGGSATFSCRGDSGGPLVRNYGEAGEQLVGLTSWSRGCGYKDIPSVYTDVAYYSKWIAAARLQIKTGAVVWVSDPARAQ